MMTTLFFGEQIEVVIGASLHLLHYPVLIENSVLQGSKGHEV